MADQSSQEFDRIDRALLRALQEDASQTIAELAELVNLSTNACWRRIKRFEEQGVIRSRVALLEPNAIGLQLTAFVSIRTNQHNPQWLTSFAEGVAAIPEVVEFYRLSGDIDYLLKIHLRDIADYDRVYKALISTAPIADVTSSFTMEEIKHTTALPVP
ncbi:MAG: Lrp/AsnC family transcriptional regulator [Pseudomonadota bacterium]